MPQDPIAKLFRSQHGVAADRQLRALGVTWSRQQSLFGQGVWQRRTSGVIELAGAPPTWRQRAMVATLSTPGSLVSGPSAARLHRLDGFATTDEVHLLIPNGSRAPLDSSIVARRSRRLDAKDRFVIDSIAVTTLPVTLVQLAGAGIETGQALDSALRRGHNPIWLHDNFVRWRDHGVRGPRELLLLLDERVNRRLPRSWFQRLAKVAFEREGVHLVDEHPVVDARGRLLAELDLAEVELRVGVECQSWAHHGSPGQQYADATRRRALRRLGWEIVEVWWRDLDRMDDVVVDLQSVIASARHRSRPA